MSCTVIVAEAVLWLLWISVTVKVTVLVPRWLQSKLVWLRVEDATLQLSEDPLSTAAAVVLAEPDASSTRVKSCANAEGASLSVTVMSKLSVMLLPLTSVRV